MLYNWHTLVRSKVTPLSVRMIIEKAKSFYDEMKVSDKCIFSGGWLRSNKKLPVRNLAVIRTV